MDDFKIIDDLPTPDSGLRLEDEARDYLYKTGKWAMGFAVLGLIGVGLGMLSTIFTLLNVANMGLDNQFGGRMILFSLLYLVCIAIFAIPVWKHYKFAQKSKEAARKRDSQALTEALKNLHGYYVWYGVLIVATIVLYFILLVGVLGYMGSQGDGFQF